MKTNRYIRLYYLAAAISIAVLFMFGIAYLNQSRHQVKYIDAVEHAYKVLSTINFCEKFLIDAEASQRGYLLTHETSYKNNFNEMLPSIDSTIIAIGVMTADNINQKVFYAQLTKFVTKKMATMKSNLSMTGNNPLYIQSLRQGMVEMGNCKDYMAKMRQEEERVLKEKVSLKNNYQKINLKFFRGTFISAAVICILAVFILFRELVSRLNAQRNLKTKINELSNSKQELEEITFAASHDLQEPMRKVRILSTLVEKRLAYKISENDLETLHRINKITEQMHVLLNDLVLYTNLLNPNEKYATVNLRDILKEAYNRVFKNEQVQFNLSGNLPTIQGSAQQLETMLVHLFENALKFKSADKNLIINVSYELKHVKESKHFWGFQSSRHYHQVTIADNGIGFDQQYNDRIFGLFQRLHTQTEYPGKGIGLSIARRVMLNHNGYITSEGEKRVGAKFILSFPVSG